jgi:hypothetical protein
MRRRDNERQGLEIAQNPHAVAQIPARQLAHDERMH